MDAKKRDDFLTVFAGWLQSAGHATDQTHADRLAWDFVVSAWDDDDDLDSWISAYEAENDEASVAEPIELEVTANIGMSHVTVRDSGGGSAVWPVDEDDARSLEAWLMRQEWSSVEDVPRRVRRRRNGRVAQLTPRMTQWNGEDFVTV